MVPAPSGVGLQLAVLLKSLGFRTKKSTSTNAGNHGFFTTSAAGVFGTEPFSAILPFFRRIALQLMRRKLRVGSTK